MDIAQFEKWMACMIFTSMCSAGELEVLGASMFKFDI